MIPQLLRPQNHSVLLQVMSKSLIYLPAVHNERSLDRYILSYKQATETDKLISSSQSDQNYPKRKSLPLVLEADLPIPCETDRRNDPATELCQDRSS